MRRVCSSEKQQEKKQLPFSFEARANFALSNFAGASQIMSLTCSGAHDEKQHGVFQDDYVNAEYIFGLVTDSVESSPTGKSWSSFLREHSSLEEVSSTVLQIFMSKPSEIRHTSHGSEMSALAEKSVDVLLASTRSGLVGLVEAPSFDKKQAIQYPCRCRKVAQMMQVIRRK